MSDLHKMLISGKVRKDGWEGLEESPNYPSGIPIRKLSELSDSWDTTVMLVPAELVPDSRTTRKIVDDGGDIRSFYVVYGSFCSSPGRDQPG